MDERLLRGFHQEMLTLYFRVKRECRYDSEVFYQMVYEQGGLDAARILLHRRDATEGFTTLWAKGRLDLTVEALVLRVPWRALFTDEEIGIAEKRLKELGYLGNDSVPQEKSG